MPSVWEAAVEVLGGIIETCETENEGQLATMTTRLQRMRREDADC